MNYWLGILGTWLVSDSVYSITLYLNAPSYSGRKQTWRGDHWVRCIRAAIGLALIVMGALGR